MKAVILFVAGLILFFCGNNLGGSETKLGGVLLLMAIAIFMALNGWCLRAWFNSRKHRR